MEISSAEVGMYLGRMVWLETPTNRKSEPYTDKMNPDTSLRDRSISGLTM
ncbi:MAG: hypothetical protein AAGI25_06300 [Bacteroidota bacterium]